MKFTCATFIVEDFGVSMNFYVNILNQKLIKNLGDTLIFKGPFTLCLKKAYEKQVNSNIDLRKNHSAQLYFETKNIVETYRIIKDSKTEILHPLIEQPWGQRVFRVYDPDNHVIEIGETIKSTVLNLHAQKLSIADIAEKASITEEFIINVLNEYS